MRRMTPRQVLRVLMNNGWYIEKQSGSHVKMRYQTKPGYVTVPMHGKKQLKPKTLKSIFQQAGLDPDRV